VDEAIAVGHDPADKDGVTWRILADEVLTLRARLGSAMAAGYAQGVEATEARVVSPWRAISSAPRGGAYVLVYVPEAKAFNEAYIAVARYEDGAWHLKHSAAAMAFSVPSHWMELPAAPL
jgi:hypothetical protein